MKSDQPKPASGEWTVRQWVDGNGDPRNSWDIRDSQGEVVCADLAQHEADKIADAHNAALAAAWRKGHADAQEPALKRIDELHKQLAAERERSIESMKHYDKQLAAEREMVQALTAVLNNIRGVAIKTDWELAKQIDNALWIRAEDNPGFQRPE